VTLVDDPSHAPTLISQGPPRPEPPFTPDRDTDSSVTCSAPPGTCATAQDFTHPDTGTLHRHPAVELTIRVDRHGVRLVTHHPSGGGHPNNQTTVTHGGPGNRRSHRARCSPPLRLARPQPAPAPPRRATRPLAPGYLPRTLLSMLIDYAMKEAAA
jgi:hypothetical protein